MTEAPARSDPRVVWFLTGSQGLYGEDVLVQVADQSARISGALDQAELMPLRDCQAGSHGRRCDPAGDARVRKQR